MAAYQLDYEENRFRGKVNDALKDVTRILDLHRNPRLAQDVDHDYGDKYLLVNQMTNSALIAQINALSYFGLSAETIQSIDKSKEVTLRFQASDSCQFLKEETVEVPDATSLETDEVTTTTGTSFFKSTTKSGIKRVVKHVKEYHWKVHVNWEISLYQGNKCEEKISLKKRTSSTVLVIQSNKRAPLPENRECKPLDLHLSWLVSQIDIDAMTSLFRIDTQCSNTKTPSKNQQVEEALTFMRHLSSWTNGVQTYFSKCVQQDIVNRHNPVNVSPNQKLGDGLGHLVNDIFVPVKALMENTSSQGVINSTDDESKSILSFLQNDNNEGTEKASPILSSIDMHKMLNEQVRSIEEHLQRLTKSYPTSQEKKNILSIDEASIVLLSMHSSRICKSYQYAVDYVEQMMQHQLTSAIGKTLRSSDVDQFLRWHNGRFLYPAPQPFCHSIRQPGHFPCGMLSIEMSGEGNEKFPIETLSRQINASTSMNLRLNAAACAELTGRMILHGWMRQKFGGDGGSAQLVARARQFSSFLLVIGTMTGPDSLDPQHAIVVQDKDEIMIPLLFEEIPTSKEFKDAIHSLSSEQQRFAKAFRKMQLGSSVIGICVIEIKPQLEILLGLPTDALTKEIELTQNLMELFVTYQVPSDLMSFDGIETSSTKEKVDNVKKHVEAIMKVIDATKEKELEEERKRATMAVAESISDAFSPSDMMLACSAAPSSPPLPVDNSSGVFPAAASFGGGSGQLKKPMGALDKRGKSAKKSFRSQEASQSHITDFQERERTHDNSSKIRNQKSQAGSGSTGAPIETKSGAIDFSALPQLLNESIEKGSMASALRSTTIKLNTFWTRLRQKNLLTKPERNELNPSMLDIEKNKALDLLDALSRSGSLPVASSELHVIISVTHSFEKDVIGTIIQDNINPIEKLEMSTLVLGSTIHGVPASQLIREEGELNRLGKFFPSLLE